MRFLTMATLASVALAGCVTSGPTTGARNGMAAAEAATGVSAANIVAYSANGAGIGGLVIQGVPNVLFYKAASTDKAQLKAAPARICGTRGVASAEDRALEHPEQMPGVRKLVVSCK
ncbi:MULTISPECIES: hypothetical protein [Gemmobacter]|uniref:Lipoprotein n=2 Tax=Gemmobacter TaxID=204456 RepID=A0A2T6B4T5_9RHOB|nr:MULTISPECIES: hypothetical protein [Gemmobacter]PTX51055.1 hypothetical protein C8N34_104174 [Gemmobacter caeni]TWJ01055.1 hypothetical protein IQ03_01771 [Gemmobacter caeni]GHC18633.1 hypothetical protein GCM10007291_16670 [Gemmobacter nanjingensis]